jgi:hypothetical protein
VFLARCGVWAALEADVIFCEEMPRWRWLVKGTYLAVGGSRISDQRFLFES